jgi:hypothetical protein
MNHRAPIAVHAAATARLISATASDMLIGPVEQHPPRDVAPQVGRSIGEAVRSEELLPQCLRNSRASLRAVAKKPLGTRAELLRIDEIPVAAERLYVLRWHAHPESTAHAHTERALARRTRDDTGHARRRARATRPCAEPPRVVELEMDKIHDAIDDTLEELIAAQPMFFVASAPLSASGHVNVSPKGLDTFCVLGPREVAYLDLTGSGVETIAHVKENGRLVIMFCAFEGKPKIVRLHGRAAVLERGTEAFDALLPRFTPQRGARSIIRLDVERIAESCGYGVPLLDYRDDRTQLNAWTERKGDLSAYRRERNRESIDGLPGVDE